MKTAIVYVSVHHGNTKKVAEAMASALSADLIDLNREPQAALSAYDLIGFASGVFYGQLHENLRRYLERADLSKEQRVFFAATCGMAYRDYTKSAKEILARRGIRCLGSFQCRGFDTFGPFGKIGGIARKHPSQRDLEKGAAFARRMLEAAEQA